jgi:hypothetical protein
METSVYKTPRILLLWSRNGDAIELSQGIAVYKLQIIS